jgi:hypothetical protein
VSPEGLDQGEDIATSWLLDISDPFFTNFGERAIRLDLINPNV